MRSFGAGEPLRIEARSPARLRWSADSWRTCHDADGADSGLGQWYVDLPAAATARRGSIAFTFFWTEAGRWEGRNFTVDVRGTAPDRPPGQVEAKPE